MFSSLVSRSLVFVVFFEAKPQFSRISIVAFFADRFQINFVEFRVDGHFLVAGRAGEVVDTPGFVEGREDIPLNDLVANVAKVTKKLMVMSFAVG